jgi:two-component system chemotaxis response regulator CheY
MMPNESVDCKVSTKTLRVLVAEDEPVSARTIVTLLERYGQCQLTARGLDAIDALRAAHAAGQPFDLLCLDVRMPGLSGMDVLKAVRQWEQDRGVPLSKGVPVIMTTVCHDPDTVLGAFNSGCEKYLVKPIAGDKLARIMSELNLI